MAARKSRHVPADMTGVRQSTSADPCTSENPSQQAASECGNEPPSRRSALFAAALTIFLVWAAGLITMALIVETPATLNIPQIQNAEFVIQGMVDPTEEGVFLVDRSWPPDATEAVVMIEELGELSLEPQQSYLIPVQHTDDGAYRVVATPKPAEVRLVYPATETTVAALEDVLGER